MLGLGETREEVLRAMQEIAAQGTHILTLGQYLQPTAEHLPIERYVHRMNLPSTSGWAKHGFQACGSWAAGAISYHAFEQEEARRV